MSDMNQKIERVVESKWLTASNRIMVLFIGAIMLPLMSWLGMMVWSDVRDANKAIAELGTELRDRIGKVETEQAVTTTRLDDVTRRVENLEQQRRGSLPWTATP
jgi:hypothetical protein